MARAFNNSAADQREDKANADKFDMTVADWKNTYADHEADRLGQRAIDLGHAGKTKEG
jgi:hypothetical protein